MVCWWLSYQDFKDTFVCNTQRNIRIIMADQVVLSGFQRYFCMLYTTSLSRSANGLMLFYQDFKDTFVCNTQPGVIFFNSLPSCFIRISKILLYAIHNHQPRSCQGTWLFYQDFKDTFVCNTQPHRLALSMLRGCFIRISKNNSAAKVQKK